MKCAGAPTTNPWFSPRHTEKDKPAECERTTKAAWRVVIHLVSRCILYCTQLIRAVFPAEKLFDDRRRGWSWSWYSAPRPAPLVSQIRIGAHSPSEGVTSPTDEPMVSRTALWRRIPSKLFTRLFAVANKFTRYCRAGAIPEFRFVCSFALA